MEGQVTEVEQKAKKKPLFYFIGHNNDLLVLKLLKQ